MPNFIPTVMSQTPHGLRATDLYSRLLSDRIIFFTGPIDQQAAEMLSAQLFFLEAENPKEDIHLYINSPGGHVLDGLAIYDTMQYIECDIRTTCLGMAASMGALLLAAGTPGKRMALPNARIMIHQPLIPGETPGGQVSDLEILAREASVLKQKSIGILAKHTGQSHETIRRDTDRNFWLGPEDAIKYGLIDRVVANRAAGTKG